MWSGSFYYNLFFLFSFSFPFFFFPVFVERERVVPRTVMHVPHEGRDVGDPKKQSLSCHFLLLWVGEIFYPYPLSPKFPQRDEMSSIKWGEERHCAVMETIIIIYY